MSMLQTTQHEPRIALPALWLALALLLALAPQAALAQWGGGGMVAPAESMDELNEAPVGAPGGFGQPGGAFGDEQGGGFGQSGGGFGEQQPGNFGPAPGQPAGAMPQGFDRSMGRVRREIEDLGPLFQTEKTYPAYEGQRIYDAVIYRRNPNAARNFTEDNSAILLETVRRVEITEEQTGQYYDDGETRGDYEAGDGIYASIQPPSTNEYIGGDTRWALERTITLLNVTQNLNPLDFFGLVALTTDRFSALPKLRDRIMERDGKIHLIEEDGDFRGWADTYLKDFRVERSNPVSTFFKLYVPKPPTPPVGDPPPAPWIPFNSPEIAKVSGQGVGGGPQREPSDLARAVTNTRKSMTTYAGNTAGMP